MGDAKPPEPMSLAGVRGECAAAFDVTALDAPVSEGSAGSAEVSGVVGVETGATTGEGSVDRAVGSSDQAPQKTKAAPAREIAMPPGLGQDSSRFSRARRVWRGRRARFKPAAGTRPSSTACDG